ncbi:RxLR effector protein [Phytophthora megakarya]|uniref:RxLR effector protein n=1 Tax=Phytophthora megakarya TaxID=4795 RepID=A0A225V489_9STRA|nr:RxLR effector protein [Phytophthora megakarya]
MLIAAREVDDTRALAAKLEQFQLTNWIIAGKSADGAFKSLQLDQAGAKLFESPTFSNWISFVAKRNREHPDTVIFSILAQHHSDDAIAQMVVAAKEVSRTKDIATKVEGLQIANWLGAGNTPDDVFKVLKLNHAGDKLFESPVFGNWASFVAKRNGEDPNMAMFSLFAKYCDGYELAKIIPPQILISAISNPRTSVMAKNLESLKITNWITAKKSADDVFKILKLEQVGDKLLDSSLFRVWVSFVTKISEGNRNKVIVKQLTNSFDDVSRARMISAATKADPSMEKLVAQLEFAQFSLWRDQRKTPQEVVMMLRGTTNADGMLRNYKKFVKIDN